MTPKEQAEAEVAEIVNAQLQLTDDVRDVPIKWERAVEMAQLLMVQAWLRGHSACSERGHK